MGRVGEKKLRNHIPSECYLDAIVSLPVRTFFANSEHTYILALTKKHRPDYAQTDPVFTYLVSSIGERLTSVKRTWSSFISFTSTGRRSSSSYR